MQGKLAKDWRKVNGAYKKKKKAIRKQKEKLQEKLEKEQEKYWDLTRPTKKKKKEPKKKQKQKGLKYTLAECIIRSMSYYDNRQRNFN